MKVDRTAIFPVFFKLFSANTRFRNEQMITKNKRKYEVEITKKDLLQLIFSVQHPQFSLKGGPSSSLCSNIKLLMLTRSTQSPTQAAIVDSSDISDVLLALSFISLGGSITHVGCTKLESICATIKDR